MSAVTIQKHNAVIGFDNFPYKSVLSFEPMIKFWRDRLTSENAAERLLAKEIVQKLEFAPELQETIVNWDILDKQKEIVDLLIQSLIPPARKSAQLTSILKPFHTTPIFETEEFQQIYSGELFSWHASSSPEAVKAFHVVKAGSMILEKLYDVSLEMLPTYVYTVTDSNTGFQRHFKAAFVTDFVDIEVVGEKPELSKEDIQELTQQIEDHELWLEKLSPEAFLFKGSLFMELIDITEEESVSRLKELLLDKEVVFEEEKVKAISKGLGNILKLSDLKVGISGLSFHPETAFRISASLWKGIFPYTDNLEDDLETDSPYGEVFLQAQALTYEDVSTYKRQGKGVKALKEEKVKSYLIAPLTDNEGKIFGILELGHEKAGKLNATHIQKINELLQVFSVALKRRQHQVEGQLEIIIKEKCTSIHPSVAWRFEEAAANLLQKRDEDPLYDEFEAIYFGDIIPLYGHADIVSSFNTRKNAIQADLIENLHLAELVLGNIQEEAGLGFPILDEFMNRIHHMISEIQEGITSEDEVRIMDFLNHELDPLFRQFSSKNPKFSRILEDYRKSLDPSMAVIYSQRKKYEDSVNKINETIAVYLTEQQDVLQQATPHYFDKYHRDGVGYSIFMGQSLMKEGVFDEMQLNNMQLWQLITMCEITRKIQEIQPALAVPLTTAQVILVQSNPIAIRFKADENKFYSEGSDNTRYEKIKNNLDQASIFGTGEILTQAGKVAVVYGKDEEGSLYKRYASYLVNKGLVEPDYEELELGPVKGVQGLRAFRFTVLLENQKVEEENVKTPKSRPRDRKRATVSSKSNRSALS
ncbi:MAG: GAF domain-containing protein [Bacteroidota bacterium]